MTNQSSIRITSRDWASSAIPWTWLGKRAASRFRLAGALMIASVLAPIGLGPITTWSWVVGLVLIGGGAIAVAAGLLGLYPRLSHRTPTLARIGALCALLAGVTGFGVIGMGTTAVLAEGVLRIDLPKPTELFKIIGLLMGVGYSVGLLSFGAASWWTDTLSRSVRTLLILGGTLLFVPVASELLRAGTGIGLPPWVLFPALGLVALDTLAIGYWL